MARLLNKTALITGGTTGIGFATAQQFLKEGARVAITGQDAGRVTEAAKQLGAGVIAIRANVSSAEDMQAVATRLQSEFGGLDILFANAGIAKVSPLTDVDEAHIDEQFDVNVKGVIFTVQKLLPLLRNPASILLTSSTAAQQGMAGMSVYSASKAAVRSLARSLSAELIGRGVRVNSISPGPIETPIFGKLGLPSEAVGQMAEQIKSGIPAGRFGQADEIAKLAVFLASDESSYIVGEDFLIDGGSATI
ncbi:SDR family oxidoreductase [Ampullimonas aquatilis]|uniref:SDR family oxidoreductase n=1 Tax=Ampullimonas aquatilis TaxID=1341549 RepID=UPI003C77282E